MSVLIKGMEMPENCCQCIHTVWNGRDDVCRFSGISALNIGRQSDCPLIEVPQHGRLIDADALKVQDGWLRDSKYFAQESSHTHITFVHSNDIYNAPTVISADKDGEV